MMSAQDDEVLKFLGQLNGVILNKADVVLRAIETLELEDLLAFDPTFAELAVRTKGLLTSVENHLDNEDFQRKVFSLDHLVEYAEILGQIAHSIDVRNSSLLTDCCAHLREFLEINYK